MYSSDYDLHEAENGRDHRTYASYGYLRDGSFRSMGFCTQSLYFDDYRYHIRISYQYSCVSPKPKEQYITRIHIVFGKMSLLLRTAISHEMKDSVYRAEKKELESAIKSLSDKYNLFEEEQKKLKRAKYSQARQLVVYKQLLQSLRKGYEVLDAVENHYFQAERSEEIDEQFDHNLERLMKYHEHILWKFEDKLKPNEDEAETMAENNEAFMEQVMCGPGANPGGLRLSVVAASMYDYGYQLDRLNRVADQISRVVDDKEQEEALFSWLRK